MTAWGMEPIIEFHTNIYDTYGETNAFHITMGATENTYVDVDCGYGMVEAEIEQAFFDSETSAIRGTAITCSVSPEGMVRIYGDASKIEYLDMSGCYISNISFPSLPNLAILDMQHNELEELDLSHLTALQALYLSDNPFGKSPLVIGSNHPDLTILEISVMPSLDPNFTIRDYPKLRTFEAWGNHGLKFLDPTGCPDLLRISIDVTPVASLDVSKNPNLLILNTAETRIPALDLSNNPYLTELYCGHSGKYNNDVALTELNLGSKPYLQRLYCADNKFTSLDISGCPALVNFDCSGNNLPGINFDSNPDLYSVNISKNCMDFVTIPADRETFGEYYYSQKPFPVSRSYAVGSVIDFSAKVNRPNSETYAALFGVSESDELNPVQLDESYYTFENGKVTLLKTYTDSVYVAFANTALPEYDLKTAKFMVKAASEMGKDNVAATLGVSSSASTVEMYVGMAGATPSTPKTFSVDFGDGNPVTFTATTSDTPLVPNVTGTRKGISNYIYTPEGEDMTAFAIKDTPLLVCDFGGSRSMRQLTVTGCQTSKIGIEWNRCLEYLDLSDNYLTTVDLSTEIGGYSKNVLSHINLANNRLEELTLNDARTITYLNVSGNQLAALDINDASNLVELYAKGNLIANLDLEDTESLVKLDISDNQLTELPVPSYEVLDWLDVSGNNITIPNLPRPTVASTYYYAPQQTLVMPTKAPMVNISREWLDLDGNTTQYTWRKASDNTVLTPEQVKGDGTGRFSFVDTSVGEIYCSISHPAYPDFTEKPILTTNVLAAEMPSNIFATFTTEEATDGTIILRAVVPDNAKPTDVITEEVYIDWSGNGDLEQYVLGRDYITFPVTTTSGAEVKCYSYKDEDCLAVFSLNAGKLAAMDASKMKTLTCFSVTDGGLTEDNIVFPASPDLYELIMSGNNFNGVIGKQYPKLYMLNLSRNPMTEIDLSDMPTLGCVYLSECGLKSATFNNPNIWDLNLSENEFETIDLSGVPAVSQLWLQDNNLTSVNVEGLSSLRVLYLGGNRLTFATLPEPKSSYYVYTYSMQQPVAIQVDGGKVDLSAQAKAGGAETTYRWFIDTPYYDDNDELVGEELIEGTEYDLTDGVTTFKRKFSHIMCVMTNEVFPNLLLYTDFVDVTETGLENAVASDGASIRAIDGDIIVNAGATTPVEVYSVSGQLLRASHTDVSGSLTVSGLPSGIYIVKAGMHTAKIALE